MITVSGGIIHLTEVTLRELLQAVETAKEKTQFTNDPMPAEDCDIDKDEYIFHQRRRGYIRVSSNYSNEEFVIHAETEPQSMESLGYRLDMGAEPISNPPTKLARKM